MPRMRMRIQQPSRNYSLASITWIDPTRSHRPIVQCWLGDRYPKRLLDLVRSGKGWCRKESGMVSTTLFKTAGALRAGVRRRRWTVPSLVAEGLTKYARLKGAPPLKRPKR